MKTIICCRATDKGVHSFYLKRGADEIFLFSQAYRKGVEKYYGKGVFIDEAMRFSKAHHDSAIEKTMGKLPKYLRYIENEYDIDVLRKHRTQKCYGRCA